MESDDENLCRFGTALEPLNEDEVPTKKPILIEDQIVTDENGKRRFHGAFTGGFSAGFWNTVGSLEGWKPQEFKSSRNEKAEHKKQKPVDFMDDEDMCEFGIAPQRVQATEDFSNETPNRKRKFQQNQTHDGPIPGVPVLHQLLRPPREGVAIRLLKQMGWKQGQGVGERMTYQKKKLAAKYNDREQYVMQKYGCEVNALQNQPKDENENKTEMDEIEDNNITFAPDDFQPYICSIKDNLFGIGYSGLSRDSVLSSGQHVNLFCNLEILSKDNKKLSIRGQAFGVGALEEEDEDIYQKDDMTKYDFSLTKKNYSKVIKAKANDSFSLEGFHEKANLKSATKKQFVISLPVGFVPRNWLLRKSRFQPLDEKRLSELEKQDEYKIRGLGRNDLNPEQRGYILGEASTSSSDNRKTVDPKLSYIDKINKKYETEIAEPRDQILLTVSNNFDKFTAVKKTIVVDKKIQIENKKIIENAKEITKELTSGSGSFKPFAGNQSKQDRYEKFIKNMETVHDTEEIRTLLKTLQPIEMREWDCEMEMKEFMQAKRIYQPLKGLMSDRFVSETNLQTESVNSESIKKTEIGVKKKTVRTKIVWNPCSQLCKRFNIAEPTLKPPDQKPTSKPKYSVFDYIETSVNQKNNFITPVIIPKKQPEYAKNVDKNFETNILIDQKTEKNSNSSEKLDLKYCDATKPDPVDLKITSLNLAKEKTKPKSELEKKIEEYKSKHPSEKKDLFKSIFDSSGEEEDENDDNMEITKTQDVNDILKALAKPASEINILRNNSPPRGIFAAFFNKSIPDNRTTVQPIDKDSSLVKSEEIKNKNDIKEKIVFTPRYKRIGETNDDIEQQPEIYGPKLPAKSILTKANDVNELPRTVVSLTRTYNANDDQVNEKLMKILSGKKSKIIDKWIEKPEKYTSEKSHKKHKKKSKSENKEELKSKKKKSKSKHHKKDRKSKKKEK